jgi:hypothetical protein
MLLFASPAKRAPPQNIPQLKHQRPVQHATRVEVLAGHCCQSVALDVNASSQ